MGDTLTKEQILELRDALLSEEGVEHFYAWDAACDKISKLCSMALASLAPSAETVHAINKTAQTKRAEAEALAARVSVLFEIMDAADDALDKDTYDELRRGDWGAHDDNAISISVGTRRKINKVFLAIDQIRNALAKQIPEPPAAPSKPGASTPAEGDASDADGERYRFVMEHYLIDAFGSFGGDPEEVNEFIDGEIAKLKANPTYETDIPASAFNDNPRLSEIVVDEVRRKLIKVNDWPPFYIRLINRICDAAIEEPAAQGAAPDELSSREEDLHIAVGNAVTLLNNGAPDPEEARSILRNALVVWSDAFEAEFISEHKR